MKRYLFILFTINACQFEVPEELKLKRCSYGGITYTIDGTNPRKYNFVLNSANDIKYPITWQNSQGSTIVNSNSNSFTYTFPADGTYSIRAFFQTNCGDYYTVASNTFTIATIFKIDLISVTGGTFQMGSIEDNIAREQPLHNVTVNSFKMGTFEITQNQYLTVMGVNPSKNICLSCPVTNVSWLQSVNFCNKLSEIEKRVQVYTIVIKKDNSGEYAEVTANFGANGYRLPTEAEWEYAAGGGSSSRTRFGNNTNIAKPSEINFNGLATNKITYSETGVNRGSIINIGSFTPNRLGIYDMAGNVSELCNDWYKEDYYKTSPSSNPIGPIFINNSNQWRVIRGGSFSSSPNLLKVFNRNFNNYWEVLFDDVGFRIVTN